MERVSNMFLGYGELNHVVMLYKNVCVQVLVAIFVVCIWTRILSSFRFHAAKHGRGQKHLPPTLPYWIPFLRHALPMVWNSQRFTARCLCGPYSLTLRSQSSADLILGASLKILVLLDPAQIKRVMYASKELDPNPFVQDMILGQLLGTPKDAIDVYKSDDGRLSQIQVAHIRQHVAGSSLISLSDKVFERLNTAISQHFMSAGDPEWVTIPDLREFVEHHVTRAITECLMGTQITEDYPDLFADLSLLADGSTEIATGLPRFVVPTIYAARDRLLANLKRWNMKVEALHSQREADPEWDAIAGSSLLRERQALYASTQGLNEDARVSQILGLLFAGNSITPSVSFWYLFEALKDTQLSDRVSAEMAACWNTNTRTYDLTHLTSRPLLQSFHSETTRLYASNSTVRVVTIPTFALDDTFTIEKGTTLFIHNKFTGQFAPGWTEVRPQAVSKALGTFWAERFLITGDDKCERYSDAGFGGCWTSFGGGEHKCPGRHFARNVGIVTLAIFLGKYECRLADIQTARKTTPNITGTAFGKMAPTCKITARLRKRDVAAAC